MPKFRNNNPEYDGAREFTIVLEDLRGQFKAFGESLQGLTGKVEAIGSDLNRLKDKVDHIEIVLMTKADKSDVLEIKSSMDRFFSTLSDHETRITHLETGRR